MTDPAYTHSIDGKKLRELSAPLVNHQHLDVAPANERSALLSGYMKVTELEPGMRLRLADVQDLFGLTTRAELPAGIKIALVVEGSARVKYGQQETELGPTEKSTGLVVVMQSPEKFTRHGRPGGRERTLTLSLTPQWLERRGLGKLLQAQHNHLPQLYPWTPSEKLSLAAWQLFAPTVAERSDPIHHMQLTGFALSLAAESLTEPHTDVHFFDESTAHTGSDLSDRQLARLMSLIDNGLARRATQADLAQQLGMSLSTLQRKFRAKYGEALGQYLRRYYLGIAREALVRDQVSVETAADLAGYTSAPNFATAFRREFGITPRECRSSARRTFISS